MQPDLSNRDHGGGPDLSTVSHPVACAAGAVPMQLQTSLPDRGATHRLKRMARALRRVAAHIRVRRLPRDPRWRPGLAGTPAQGVRLVDLLRGTG